MLRAELIAVRHCRCFFQREFWPWSVLPYPTVFADIGFTPAEAAELTAKSSLIIAIKDTIARRKLTQQEAARLCGTDQPTLSKVFRGRMESVTVDRLASWLTSLGRDVEIIVKPAPP
jgi:predicted XRE-type DNA-binding protein